MSTAALGMPTVWSVVEDAVMLFVGIVVGVTLAGSVVAEDAERETDTATATGINVNVAITPALRLCIPTAPHYSPGPAEVAEPLDHRKARPGDTPPLPGVSRVLRRAGR